MPLPRPFSQQKHYKTCYSTQTRGDDVLYKHDRYAVLFFTIYGWNQEDIFSLDNCRTGIVQKIWHFFHHLSRQMLKLSKSVILLCACGCLYISLGLHGGFGCSGFSSSLRSSDPKHTETSFPLIHFMTGETAAAIKYTEDQEKSYQDTHTFT